MFFAWCFPFESLPVLHWRMNKEHLQASLLDIHNCLRQWSFNVSGSLDQQKLQQMHLNMYYYYARYGEISKVTGKSCENQIQIFIRKYISNCMLSKQFFLGLLFFNSECPKCHYCSPLLQEALGFIHPELRNNRWEYRITTFWSK